MGVRGRKKKDSGQERMSNQGGRQDRYCFREQLGKWRAGAQRHHPGWNSIVQEAERKCKDRGLGLDL